MPTEQDALIERTDETQHDAVEATLATLTAQQQAEVLHLAGMDGETSDPESDDAKWERVLADPRTPEVLDLLAAEAVAETEATKKTVARPAPNKRDVKLAQRAAHAAAGALDALITRSGRPIRIDVPRLQTMARVQSMGEALVARGLISEEELLQGEYQHLAGALHQVRQDIEQQLFAEQEQRQLQAGPDAGKQPTPGPQVQPVRAPDLVLANGQPVRTRHGG